MPVQSGRPVSMAADGVTRTRDGTVLEPDFTSGPRWPSTSVTSVEPLSPHDASVDRFHPPEPSGFVQLAPRVGSAMTELVAVTEPPLATTLRSLSATVLSSRVMVAPEPEMPSWTLLLTV